MEKDVHNRNTRDAVHSFDAVFSKIQKTKPPHSVSRATHIGYLNKGNKYGIIKTGLVQSLVFTCKCGSA